MKITERLLDTLKSYEGYARKLANGDCEAYPDPASKADGKPWTIGWGTTTYNAGGKTKYGRTLVQKGDTLTREQAEAEFIYDVEEVAKKVEAIGVPLNQNEFEAVCSFAANAGFPAPMVARLKRSKSEFCNALDLYVRGENGAVVPGLVRRRNEEQALFLTPPSTVNVAANTDWYLLSNTGLYGMKGDKATETVRTWPSSEPVKALEHNMIVNLERGVPTFWENQPEAPKPTGFNKAAIVAMAKSVVANGRSHAPGNWIDVNVLDPMRKPMQDLGQLGTSENDSFYNWCASWVTYVLRQAGHNIPNQPMVGGKPYWATVALVQTWKAWAQDKGAWRPSINSEPGDIVIYDWDQNGVTDHIGIILENRADGVLAAEGNKSNKEMIIFRERSLISGSIDTKKLLS